MVLLGLLPVTVVGEFPDLHCYIPHSYEENSNIKIPTDEGVTRLYVCNTSCSNIHLLIVIIQPKREALRPFHRIEELQ